MERSREEGQWRGAVKRGRGGAAVRGRGEGKWREAGEGQGRGAVERGRGEGRGERRGIKGQQHNRSANVLALKKGKAALFCFRKVQAKPHEIQRNLLSQHKWTWWYTKQITFHSTHLRPKLLPTPHPN